jgi:hypothetical protein
MRLKGKSNSKTEAYKSMKTQAAITLGIKCEEIMRNLFLSTEQMAVSQ